MQTILVALTPVFTLIFVGFLIKRWRFLAEEFWPAAEKLTYFLLMPALLIHNLANKNIHELPWREFLLTAEGTVLVSAGVVSFWWVFKRQAGGPLFTSVFQGGVRFNTFVALAVAEAMFGSKGLLLAAMAAGFAIPLINLLCISAFSLTVAATRFSVTGLVKSLTTNPLILGCLIGGMLNLSGVGLHSGLDGTMALAGKAAFPIGLMAVGAAYRLENFSSQLSPLFFASLVQFIVKPLTALAFAHFFGMDKTATCIVVLLFSVPTAPSAYILSRQLGGDSAAMASIITLQSGLSFFSLPLTLALLT